VTPPVRLAIEGVRAVVTFDSPGRSTNTLGVEAIHELERLLDTLESNRGLRGAVLVSGKPSNFLAGADLDELDRIENEAQARAWVERGQSVARRLERLPFPTVARIHGAAMGGGLEMALACTFRVASDAAATRLGLPEVRLGLCTALGGTWRLPRRVGLERGLDLLLTGRQLTAREALAFGILDEVVPEPALDAAAQRWLEAGLRAQRDRRRSRWLAPRVARDLAVGNPVGRAVVCAAASRRLARGPGGGLPASRAILAAVRAGPGGGGRRAEAVEAREFGALALSETSRALVALHRSALAAQPKRADSLEGRSDGRFAVGVLGAGLMGRGIAVAAARVGHPVRIYDLEPAALGRTLADAAATLAGERRRGRRSAAEERAGGWHLQPAVRAEGFVGCGLVIEAIVEDLEAKRELLARVAATLPASCVIASNTSTLPIARLAAGLPAPERVLGLHFFSPVARMPLVEVIRHAGSGQAAVERARRFAAGLGKTPVVVGDGPGFYTTRILAPYLAVAAAHAAAGVPIGAIDAAGRAAGFSVGPLALVDEVGLDVAARAAAVLHAAFPDRLPAPGPFERLLASGRRGRKSGLGFYDYRRAVKRADPGVRALLDASVERAAERLAPVSGDELVEGLRLAMVGEAVRCLEEGILASPRDGDLAAVLGLGFPAALGGPFRWLDRIGAAAAAERFARLRETTGSPIFDPPARLLELASRRGSFHP